MNILLVTNTFTPHVGGVARSVVAFTEEYRRRGHAVMTIAPEFDDQPEREDAVYRVPALQHFNASDFSVALPVHPSLSRAVNAFEPDVVHAQHPFLLGVTAVRLARHRNLPLVFTHHTLYEQYTHYVPGDSAALKRYVIELSTRYANLADQVFAPSESLRRLLLERGVTSPVEVVPTGVQLRHFEAGDGAAFRHRLGIPPTATVVGHLGRLAPEKNLDFLTRALIAFLAGNPDAHALIVGVGPHETRIRDRFQAAGLGERLHWLGILSVPDLADALHAMDVFAFASTSETQGMVLTEAMAAGVPVVALDASGVRDVVIDGRNGRLLPDADVDRFREALNGVVGLSPSAKAQMQRAARDTARAFSLERSADKALQCYRTARPKSAQRASEQEHRWEDMVRAIRTEWEILKQVAGAGEALWKRDPGRGGPPRDESPES